MLTKQQLASAGSVYLQKLEFVQWDRMADAYDKAKVLIFYGWIDREQDSYKDFVHLELYATGNGYQVAFTTSSEKYTYQIAKLLEMEESHEKCKRVEDIFPTLKNVIKLKK